MTFWTCLFWFVAGSIFTVVASFAYFASVYHKEGEEAVRYIFSESTTDRKVEIIKNMHDTIYRK